jgi:hypothetical protein
LQKKPHCNFCLQLRASLNSLAFSRKNEAKLICDPMCHTSNTGCTLRLIWPILLGVDVADAAPLLASARGPGQGPWPIVTSLGNPVGPASTSPQAFHGWTRRPPYFPGFAWWIKLGMGSFDVKPWTGHILNESYEWRALFS